MMRFVIVALLMLAAPVLAQQPPRDPRLLVAEQMIAERTSQVIELAARVQALAAEVARLKEEAAKAAAEVQK